MPYKIPLFDLNFDEREEKAVLEVIRSRWISTGPKTAELEQRFANMLRVDHAVALANCTTSLHLAMKLAGVQPGDEVICPSLTFVATVNAIRHADAVPVFADITGCRLPVIDPDDIERKITAATRTIVVMHYSGFPCHMDSIMELARHHGLTVIEDACHGPLSEYKGRKLGTIGDIGCFSFFSNKNISTGEGGMLVTGREEIARQTRLLRSHGMTTMSYDRARGHSTDYDVVELGYNYRMDDIRAAIGIVQLAKLEEDLHRRALVRRQYIGRLSGVPQLEIPFSDHDGFVSNYIFPVVLKDAGAERRNQVREQLAEAGIQTSVHYPAVHRFSIYRETQASLPETEYFCDNQITLPMYAGLKTNEIEYIAATLNNILKKS